MPSIPRIRRSVLPRRWLLAGVVVPLLELCLAAGSAFAAEESAAATETEITNAIWKDQEIAFTYSSSYNIFSCGALEGRVKSLLLAVGAYRQNLDVTVSGCSDFLFAPLDDPPLIGRSSSTDRLRARNLARVRDAQFSQVRIRVRSPTAATPDALAELEKSRPYRELLGKVTGTSDTIQEAAAQFPARRERVSLSTRALDLEPEECELLERMIADVFPKLGVKVVKVNMSCFPPRVSLLRPRIEVEALLKTPPAE